MLKFQSDGIFTPRQPQRSSTIKSLVLSKLEDEQKKYLTVTHRESNNILNKVKKLEVLADTDQQTIKAQQKKLFLFKTENMKIKRLYSTLKRNYDSVTLHAMKDAKRSHKALSMEQGYLK